MTKSPRNILFIFQGGTCGSFVKTLFWAAMGFPVKNYYDAVQGHSHYTDCNIPHTHLNDMAEIELAHPDAKYFVLITYSADDIDLISKMQYGKFTKDHIALAGNLQTYLDKYPSLSSAITNDTVVNEDVLETEFRKVIKCGYSTWLDSIPLDRMSLILNFKDIFYSDPNILISEITEFLGHPPLVPNLQKVIEDYRKINEQYLLTCNVNL